MDALNLIESFSEFKDMKNIDRVTMMNIVDDVFRSVIARQFGTADNFDIIININHCLCVSCSHFYLFR